MAIVRSKYKTIEFHFNQAKLSIGKKPWKTKGIE